MEEQGTGPQEMSFVRAPVSLFQAKMSDLGGLGQALSPEASLWSTCPTLEISSQVHRVPGTVPTSLDDSLLSGRPRVFLENTLPSRFPPLPRQSA